MTHEKSVEEIAEEIVGSHKCKDESCTLVERVEEALSQEREKCNLYRREAETRSKTEDAQRLTINRLKKELEENQKTYEKNIDFWQRRSVERGEKIASLEKELAEREAEIKNFEFLTGACKDDVRYSANKIAALKKEVEEKEQELIKWKNMNCGKCASLQSDVLRLREAFQTIYGFPFSEYPEDWKSWYGEFCKRLERAKKSFNSTPNNSYLDAVLKAVEASTEHVKYCGYGLGQSQSASYTLKLLNEALEAVEKARQ